MTSITAGVPNNRKTEGAAAMCPSGSTYKCALVKVAAVVGLIDTYAALAGNEVTAGGGYTAGGMTLTGYQAALTGSVASIDWADPVWPSATISADGAIIYDTGSGKVVAVLDFGTTVSSTNGDFTVNLPAAGVGVVRVA